LPFLFQRTHQWMKDVLSVLNNSLLYLSQLTTYLPEYENIVTVCPSGLTEYVTVDLCTSMRWA
jgi:hypothetical protein